ATGDMSALQICSPTVSLLQGLVTASSPSPLHSSQKHPEEALMQERAPPDKEQ
ncbi:cAMP-responsive element modulator-like isoform X1, partial [Clarias magur]